MIDTQYTERVLSELAGMSKSIVFLLIIDKFYALQTFILSSSRRQRILEWLVFFDSFFKRKVILSPFLPKPRHSDQSELLNLVLFQVDGLNSLRIPLMVQKVTHYAQGSGWMFVELYCTPSQNGWHLTNWLEDSIRKKCQDLGLWDDPYITSWHRCKNPRIPDGYLCPSWIGGDHRSGELRELEVVQRGPVRNGIFSGYLGVLPIIR